MLFVFITKSTASVVPKKLAPATVPAFPVAFQTLLASAKVPVALGHVHVWEDVSVEEDNLPINPELLYLNESYFNSVELLENAL